MDNKNIKVSIIMPVYKVEEYVGKAIESIQAQLKDWEFLIVDVMAHRTKVGRFVTRMQQKMIESK